MTEDAWVRDEFRQNREDHKEIMRDLTALKVSVAGLKVKSGVWGAMGAAVPLLLGFIAWLLAGGG